jgi:hypothetical protein
MRPRNVLKIFSHARGFASNLAHAKITETDIEKGLRAYSQDLLVELDHELTDVFPAARDLLYHFIDSTSELDAPTLTRLITEANLGGDDVERVLEFLLYYGILGIKTGESTHYIYDVHYDLKALLVRAKRGNLDLRYVVNSAFWPALSVRDVVTQSM